MAGTANAVLVVAQAVLVARIVAAAFLHGAGLSRSAPDLTWLLVVLAGRAVCAGAFEVAGRLGAQRSMAQLRARLVDHVLHTAPIGPAQRRSGELAVAAVQGVEALETWFARYLPQAILAVTVPVVVLAWVLPADPVAGLILLVTVPLVPAFMVLIGLAARTQAQRRWRRLNQLAAHVLDVMRGLETLRAHAREDHQVPVMGRATEALRRETMATLRVAFISALALELIAMLGVALVAATVGLQLVGGHLRLADGLAVLILAPELYLPVRLLGQQFHAAQDGMAATEQIFAVLDEPPTIAAARRPRSAARSAPDPARGPVALDGVSARYPGERPPAVRDLSLSVSPGEHLALCGSNGSGKSTVVALLMRLLDPVSGELRCDGVDLGNVAPHAWRARIGWLAQRPTIFAGTVEDNLRLAAPGASAARLHRAILGAELGSLIATLPAGLQTRIGEGGRPLSAGETQRVALGRLILRDAPLLIADEPTAHLDAVTATTVGDALLRAAAGRSLLVLTHREALAARVDRTIVLSSGSAVPAMPAAVALA